MLLVIIIRHISGILSSVLIYTLVSFLSRFSVIRMSLLSCISQDPQSINLDDYSAQFISKLNALSLRLSDIKNDMNTSHSSSHNLHQIFSPHSQIAQIVISSSHIAFLLSTNEICRIKYRILPLPSLIDSCPCPDSNNLPRQGYNSEEVQEFNTSNESSHSLPIPSDSSSIPRFSNLHAITDQIDGHSLDSDILSSSNFGRRRGLQSIRNGSRALNMRNFSRHSASNLRRNYLINPARPFRTSSEVPDDLINQAQAVLQCKNRLVISRELQRTGLDVNQAVNNLLSREDDGDEEESISTVLGSEELLYLFESGSGTTPMPFVLPPQEGENYTLESSVQSLRRLREIRGTELNSGRESRLGFSRPTVSDTNLDRLSDIILSYTSLPGFEQNEHHMNPPLNDKLQTVTMDGDRNLHNLQKKHYKSHSSNSKVSSSSYTDLSPRIEFFQGPQWWIDGDSKDSYSFIPPQNSSLFNCIASTDTDLLAISVSGYLTYWPWDQLNGKYSNKHHTFPFYPNIGIKSTDRIRLLTASRFRISILTTSNFVASFCDRTLKSKLPSSICSLEVPAQQLRLLSSQTVLSLTCSDIFSACITSNGHVFWWGCLPYSDRKRTIMRVKNKFRSQQKLDNPRNGIPIRSESIREGSSVVINESPFYSIGTRALYLQKEALVGILQENIYSLNEKCRFKIFLNYNDPAYTENRKDSKVGVHKPCSTEHSYSATPSAYTWHCKDIIFLDEPEFHSSPGHVVKIDGNFAVVSFPETNSESSKENLVNISSCRVVKKEDLIIHKSAHYQKGPLCVSFVPKKLTLRPDCTPISIAANNRGLHMLYIQNSIPKLGIISLDNSRIENIQYFPHSLSSYFLQKDQLILSPGSTNHFQPLYFIQDVRGNLLPLIKTQSNTFKDVPYIPLPPVRALCSYFNFTSRISLVIFACDNHSLTPRIISNSPGQLFNEIKYTLKESPLFTSMTAEYTNGNNNILHTAIGASLSRFGTSTEEVIFNDINCNSSKGEVWKSVDIREDSTKYQQYESNFSTTIPSPSHQYDITSSAPSPNYSFIDSSEAFTAGRDDLLHSNISNSEDCIEILLNLMEMELPRLLVEINLDGHTPFMQAVHERAYEVALHILTIALRLSNVPQSISYGNDFLLKIIFPPASFLDDNPLFMLSANDRCSVTWTGESHEISIDIYECRTCGLIGDYCCCSECSRVCHKGHDCKKKMQPMKAFCDCSKLCNCRALVSGNQVIRLTLFQELLKIGSLQTFMNSHGEYILNFLANTYSRQVREQTNRLPSYNVSKSGLLAGSEESFMFSKRALDICLLDWNTVVALFTAHGMISSSSINDDSYFMNRIIQPVDSNPYLNSQQCISHIETFVYTLLTNDSSDLITHLLSSINIAYNNDNIEANRTTSKFLRSVIRIHLISSYDQWGPNSIPSKKRNNYIQQNVQLVYRSLNILSLRELWKIAKSVIVPIQLGVIKPCKPMTIECQKTNFAEEFFKYRSLPTNLVPNMEGTEYVDSDCRSSLSEYSENSDFLMNESDSLAIPEDLSVTTHATIGSSHIVPYISGDSTSDSDDIPHDEGLDSSPDLEDDNTRMQPISNSIISLSPNLHPIIDTSLVTKQNNNSSEDLSLNAMLLNSMNENLSIQNEITSQTISPYNINVQTPLVNMQPHLSVLNSESGDTSLHLSRDLADLSWQPAFELFSHRNNLSAQHKRKQNYVKCAQDSCVPSLSHQEQVLARAFHFLIEQLVDVMVQLSVVHLPSLTWKPSDINNCCADIWYDMEPLLVWLIQVMDPLESQLRFGSSLTSPYSAFLSIQRDNEGHRTKNIPNSNITQDNDVQYDRNLLQSNYKPISPSSCNTNMDSIQYLLSLTRSNFNEHREYIPPINFSSIEHIGYILDAVLHFLHSSGNVNTQKSNQSLPKNNFEQLYIEPTNRLPDSPSNSLFVAKIESLSDQGIPGSSPISSKNIIPESLQSFSYQRVECGYFFKRSPCLGFFGCPSPNHLAPIESIPCAEMPHILQPQTRRELLFGAPLDPIIPDTEPHSPFSKMNALTILLTLPLIKCFSHIDRLASFRSLIKKFLSGYTERELELGDGDLNRAANILLGRWRLSIELYCKFLHDKNRCENIRVLRLLQDFPSKEEKFREEMEKITYRLGKSQRELPINVSRDRTSLICDTFTQLDSFVESRHGLLTPLCVKQVKVSFKNEQGEGSGVTRSFYTSFADAILSDETLPSLECLSSQRTDSVLHAKRISVSVDDSCDSSNLLPLNISALPFYPQHLTSEISRDKILQGTRIYPQVARLIGSLHSGRVTGMLLELQDSQLFHISNNRSLLKKFVLHAYEIITDQINTSNLPTYDELTPSIQLSDFYPVYHNDTSDVDRSMEDLPSTKRFKLSEISELSPLFFEPGKVGFYSPRVGRYTSQRKSAFVCVGRIIGLCLLTNELFPASFTRHVLKYLIGKEDSICWQDYAFMDPIGFESLRKILLLAQEGNSVAINSLELTFQISLSTFETIDPVDLVFNGSSIPVTIDNAEHYVKLYTEYRMKHAAGQALVDIQLGLSQVIPIVHFSNLSPEDLRLMLNGCNSFNLDSLKKIVVISNESKQDKKIVSKFIKWFWSVLRAFSEREKQDLLYFWTSSPKMPSSIHSYQPEPSIHIRPPEENHLPTANTCIARMYIPLYSTRPHLKSKLLLAIKTKTFGFV